MTYLQWKKLPHKDWNTEPVSPTCQVVVAWDQLDKEPTNRMFCDCTTVKAYPAVGNGWMSLCLAHGQKHKEAFDVYELIANGERWE